MELNQRQKDIVRMMAVQQSALERIGVEQAWLSLHDIVTGGEQATPAEMAELVDRGCVRAVWFGGGRMYRAVQS